MGYRMGVTGVEWGALGRGAQYRAGRVVEETAQAVAEEARVRAPVDTGALRNSIAAARQSESAAVVTVGVEYGEVVEIGSSRMAARPYLLPALESRQEPFAADLASALGGDGP